MVAFWTAFLFASCGVGHSQDLGDLLPSTNAPGVYDFPSLQYGSEDATVEVERQISGQQSNTINTTVSVKLTHAASTRISQSDTELAVTKHGISKNITGGLNATSA